MQKAEVCMFCYYRNKRLAACGHVDSKPDVQQNAVATVPSAIGSPRARPAPASKPAPRCI